MMERENAPSRRARAALACAAGILALTLGACGSSSGGEADKAPRQILEDAAAALKGARSVHIKGEAPGSSGSPRVPFDVDTAGKDSVRGRFTIEGASVTILSAGGQTFLGGREFWRKQGGDAAAQVIGDRFLLISPGTAEVDQLIKLLGDLGDFKSYAASLTDVKGEPTKGSQSSINGTPAISISDSTPTTTYVAVTGTPYPLEKKQSGGSGGSVDFSDFNKDFGIKVPEGYIDTSKLGGSTASPSAPPTPVGR